jgi:hypothetical protein
LQQQEISRTSINSARSYKLRNEIFDIKAGSQNYCTVQADAEGRYFKFKKVRKDTLKLEVQNQLSWVLNLKFAEKL